MRLKRLHIKNFRGIKDLSMDFNCEENLFCIIGRGDSCKTTFLEAISLVFSPRWDISFNDTDFYNCEINNNIEIEASFTDFPKEFLSEDKFGLYISDNQDKPLLNMSLIVDKTLEPKWVIKNLTNQDEKIISATDRRKLGCYMISDNVDRHFYWNKGSSLYTLFKSLNKKEDIDSDNEILESLRSTKNKINEISFEELKGITFSISNQLGLFGLELLEELSTTIDFRDLVTKDGRLSLHEKGVPLRLKGKGSKRITSFAIQFLLVQNGGILLVDEIEQGLEPDRIKHLIRSVRSKDHGQVFLTTHSRDAITELEYKNLILLIKDKFSSKIDARYLGSEDNNGEKLQKVIRACPEAFFAKKVIVCEGATEVGICRALDDWRLINNLGQMSSKDCAYVDGTGSTIMKRAEEINKTGIKVAVFCDSDSKEINATKNNLKEQEILIFDCKDALCIEKQVFEDLSWHGIKKLINYVIDIHYNKIVKNFNNSINDINETKEFNDEWWKEFNADRDGIRDKLSNRAIENKWFKRIDFGKKLGEIIFEDFKNMDDQKHLKTMLKSLSDWVDE